MHITLWLRSEHTHGMWTTRGVRAPEPAAASTSLMMWRGVRAPEPAAASTSPMWTMTSCLGEDLCLPGGGGGNRSPTHPCILPEEPRQSVVRKDSAILLQRHAEHLCHSAQLAAVVARDKPHPQTHPGGVAPGVAARGIVCGGRLIGTPGGGCVGEGGTIY